MSKPSTASLADLQRYASDRLRESFSGSDAERTDHLRAVAQAFASAREHFYTKEGEPDWHGRTFAYRTWVRSVMSLANVPAETLSSTQAAIRYHVGNVLRERLGDEELARLGLRKESPRERSVEKRERTSEALALMNGGQAIESLEEIRSACTALVGVLKRINLESLAAPDRKEAVAALRTVLDAAKAATE